MAETAVTFLLENLQNLLDDQINLISGVEVELKLLRNDLELATAVLQDSANKKGEAVKQSKKIIREAAYEAQDRIDACLTQAAANKSIPFWIATLNSTRLNLAKTLRTFRLQELQPQLDQAYKVLAIAEASGTSAEEPWTEYQRVPSSEIDEIVGFEDEACTIIKYLREESEQLDVISIVGMPGVGKTTLAWKIYCHNVIQHKFPTLIWVCVSQDFNMKNAFLTILNKFTGEDMSKLPNFLLADIVRKKLVESRFLLVIDGVHTTEDWRLIEAALPKKNRYGKVLITTQNRRVATQASRNREPYQLRFLNFDESWELLQQEVFGKYNGCPPELEGPGKKIAEQCGGVPLALVVIGGILAEKGANNRRDFWAKVSDSVSTYLQEDKQKRAENIMSLSYSKLPHDLRDCFLYIGVFPKDTEIPAWKLIRLWIAEGFIQHSRERSLEEVAEDNLNELVGRNLVMVEKTKANGNIKTCRVHNMIREFCRIEAAKDNLFEEVKRLGGVFHPDFSEIQMSRRLCIHSDVVDFLRRKPPKNQKVRSFLCFSEEAIILQPEYVAAIPEAFNLLRVLDVNPIEFPKFPSKITRLIHLRYIALSGNNFNALPEAVFKLWNLQTIRIDTTSRTFEIRANIWKMMQLRHVKTKAAIIINKDAKGKPCENLQTLSRLSTESFTEDIFHKALNLKNLGIRGELGILLKKDCLSSLDRLEKLKLVHDVHPKVTSEDPLISLPHPKAFPPNLRILELSCTFLEWEHMATLGKLPTLEILKLKANAFMGRVWEVDGGFFPYLEVLLIEHTDLELWTASEDSFPRLRCLVLKNCERLEEIPHVLVRRLQVLDIERVTKSVVDSAKRIEMEKQQMQDKSRAERGRFKLTIAPGDEP